MGTSDDGRQKRRQSSDFKEIVNIQSEMQSTDLKWSIIFHNWEDPTKCPQAKKIIGCEICDMISKGESVEQYLPKRNL